MFHGQSQKKVGLRVGGVGSVSVEIFGRKMETGILEQKVKIKENKRKKVKRIHGHGQECVD